MLGIMKNMPEIFKEQIDDGDIWSAMIPYINGTMKFMEEVISPNIFSVDGKEGMQKVVEMAATLMIADEIRKVRKAIESGSTLSNLIDQIEENTYSIYERVKNND